MSAEDMVTTRTSSLPDQDITLSPHPLIIHFGETQLREKSAITFWIVPTTHEDLSWYTTAVRTALRVAEHKDGVIKVLTEDPNSRFTFGFPSSVPKMLRAAGIDNLIFTRGLGDEAKELIIHLQNITRGGSYDG